MQSRVIQVINGSQLDWSSDDTQYVFVEIDRPSAVRDTLCVMNTDGTELRRIAYSCLDPRWCPSDSKILCSWIGRLTLVDPDEDYIKDYFSTPSYKPLILCDKSVTMGNYSWSPDGSNIAFSSDSALYVIAADGSNLRCIKDNAGKSVLHMSWSPDGCWLAYADEGIEAIHIKDGRQKRLSSRGGFPSWNPVNNTIAFYVSPAFQHFEDKQKLPTEIRVIDFDTDKLEAMDIHNAEVDHNMLQSLVWSPNGKHLAFAMTKRKWFQKEASAIFVLNVSTKQFTEVMEGSHAGDSSIKWSRDSSKIAVCLTPDFNTRIIQLQL